MTDYISFNSSGVLVNKTKKSIFKLKVYTYNNYTI